MKGIIRKGSNAEKRLRLVASDIEKKINTGKFGSLAMIDISSVCNVAKELVAKGVASTFITRVAEYFDRLGFKVVMDFDGVNYVIVA